MTIDEIKTEVRKIEKYYDFNHQTNDYDVLVNLTEIANLILLQNKISYNKALDDFVKVVKKHNWNIRNRNENEFIYGAIDRLAEQLKAGGENGV